MNKLSTEPSLREVREAICDILAEWEEYCCIDNVSFRGWEDVKAFVDRRVEEAAEDSAERGEGRVEIPSP